MTDVKDEIIEQLRDQVLFLTHSHKNFDTFMMRDRFAMAALNGLMHRYPSMPTINLAEISYNIADAMIEARKGKEHE